MLDQRNGVLLLLARGINVSEKERNIVTTDESHYAPIIVVIHVCFHGGSASRIVSLLTVVHCLIRNFRWLASLGWFAPRRGDTSPNAVNVLLAEEVLGTIKLGAVARIFPVPLAKIPISGNDDVCTSEDLLLARIRNKMQSTYVRPVRPNLSKEKQAGHRR